MKRIGIDVGSLYIGSVVIENERIVDARYTEHRGSIHTEREHLFSQNPYQKFDCIGLSGNIASDRRNIDRVLALV